MAETQKLLFAEYTRDIGLFFRNLAKEVPWLADIRPSRERAWPTFISPVRVPWRDLREAAAIHLGRRARQARWRRLPLIHQLQLAVMLSRVTWRFLAAITRIRRGGYTAVVVWNGLRFPDNVLALAARVLGVPVLYFELGALPNTLTIDARGVNFRNSVPRDPDFYRDKPRVDPAALGRAAVRPTLQKKRCADVELPPAFVFAPFQVEADTQIVAFSPWIRDMRAFYAVLVHLRRRLQESGRDLPVVIKEHPSCLAHFTDLHRKAGRDGIMFANQVPTAELIARSACVVTINSSVGLEALQQGKPVITAGDAFYALPGLAAAVRDIDSLHAAVMKCQPPDRELLERFLGWLASDYYVRRFMVAPDVIDRLATQGGEDWPAIVARMRCLLGFSATGIQTSVNRIPPTVNAA